MNEQIINSPTVEQSVLNKFRKNKFILVLDLPSKLKDKSNFYKKKLQFTIVGTIIPSIKLYTSEIRYAGQTLKIANPARESYDDLNITFKIDNEWKNWMTIYNWINVINDNKQSIFDSHNLLNLNKNNIQEAFKDYVCDLSIYVCDEFDKQLIKFVYTNAFPCELSKIETSYTNGDEVDCNAIFKYSQFYPQSIN